MYIMHSFYQIQYVSIFYECRMLYESKNVSTSIIYSTDKKNRNIKNRSHGTFGESQNQKKIHC